VKLLSTTEAQELSGAYRTLKRLAEVASRAGYHAETKIEAADLGRVGEALSASADSLYHGLTTTAIWLDDDELAAELGHTQEDDAGQPPAPSQAPVDVGAGGPCWP